MIAWAFGIDIGFTNLRVAMVDGNGKVLGSLKGSTDRAGGPGAVRSQIVMAANELASSMSTAPAGAGVGIAGQVDIRKGIVRRGPNLFWDDESFERELERELGVRTVLRNDVVMATIGEWRHGAGKGSMNICCLLVGSGIGGGAITNGVPVEGNTGSACHFGHIMVDPHGRQCTCGRTGCMESVAGGWAIAAGAREAVARDPVRGRDILTRASFNIDAITSKEVAEAANAGDHMALEIRDDIAGALAEGIADVVNSFDPEKLVLGGTIVNSFPDLLPMVRRKVLDRALRSTLDGLEIVHNALGDDAGVIGAASSVLYPPWAHRS